MGILEHLEKEHREAEQLVAQLKDSEEGQKRSDLLDELRSSLQVHMAVEERFVYPIAAEVADEEESEEGENEHDLIRQGLDNLDELKSEPGFGAAVDMFKSGLSHHVEDEETEMFPELREKAADRIAKLDPEELEEAVKKNGASTKDGGGDNGPTRDELYEKAKEQDIEGRSSMNKDELAQAVREE